MKRPLLLHTCRRFKICFSLRDAHAAFGNKLSMSSRLSLAVGKAARDTSQVRSTQFHLKAAQFDFFASLSIYTFYHSPLICPSVSSVCVSACVCHCVQFSPKSPPSRTHESFGTPGSNKTRKRSFTNCCVLWTTLRCCWLSTFRCIFFPS